MSKKGDPKFKNEELKELYLACKEKPKKPKTKAELDLKKNTNVSDLASCNTETNAFMRMNRKNIDPDLDMEIIDEVKEVIPLQYSEFKSQNIQNERIINSKPQYSIVETSFYPMSSEDIKRKAIFEVTNPSLINFSPKSIFDARLGCTEHVNFCPTCKLDIHKCSGHYGYIKLNKWFIHPSFKNPTLYCLRCICHYCGQTYITKEILEASGIKTKGIPGLKERAELSDKFHSCHKCPPMFFDYNKEFKNGYIVTYKQNNATMQQSIENIDKIFSTISKEGIELLGFEEKSEPKNFIMKDLMVTPSLSRPTIHIENLVRHDYISLCYADIISKNNELKHIRK